LFTVGDKIVSAIAVAWEHPKPATGEIIAVLPKGDNPECVETFYTVRWPGGTMKESTSTLRKFRVVE
jgi:hypothetical protein